MIISYVSAKKYVITSMIDIGKIVILHFFKNSPKLTRSMSPNIDN